MKLAAAMAFVGLILSALMSPWGVETFRTLNTLTETVLSQARDSTAVAPGDQQGASGRDSPAVTPKNPLAADNGAVPPPSPAPGGQQGEIRVTLSNGRVTSGSMRSFFPTGLTFQVDYKADGGRTFPGRDRYFWVIRSRHGLASDPMPLQLSGEGVLSGSATRMTRDDGPFESYIEERPMGPFGAQRKVSNSVTLSWIEPPSPAPSANRPASPGFPRPPFGRRR